MVDTPTKKNGLLKLLSSGITETNGKVLGYKFLTGAEMRALCPSFKDLTAIAIPYYDLDGEPISDWPKGDPFVRFRYTAKPTDFSAIAGKLPRYVQMPSTAPVAYYPRCVKNWREVASNPTKFPIIITEGEFKAAKACLMGFNTIGVGGVFNWRAPKLGKDWIDSLDLIDWRRRKVFLAWDSNFRENSSICISLHNFAGELERRGAIVYLLLIPTFDESVKMGLDDFLVHEGAGAEAAMNRILEDAVPIGLARPLWGMNERFVYAANPGMIVDVRSGQKIPPSSFKEHNQSTAMYQERTVQKDGTISYKPVPAAPAWLKWPCRREVAKLDYAPGKPQFAEIDGQQVYNTWPGLAIEPMEGSVQPFLDLFNHLYSIYDDKQKHWQLCWFAYPLQYPGTKLYTASVLFGMRHGTGKSLMGYTMKAIYGTNFGEVGSANFHGQFNEWSVNKQFIMGDDVIGSEKRKYADELKRLITQLENRINEKFIPSYTVKDCVNYFFTSNHPDVSMMEDDDRRMAIFEVVNGPLAEEFYRKYVHWLHNEDGAAKLLHFFYEYDVSDFNPAAPAIKTNERALMIDINKSDVALWTKNLVEAPDAVLKQGEMVISKDLFTSKELLGFYDPLGKGKVSANGISRELAKLQVRHVYNGRPVKIPKTGEQSRYYALRNVEKWSKAPYNMIVDHITDWMNRQGENVRKHR